MLWAEQKLTVPQQDDQGDQPMGRLSPGESCDHCQVPADATMQDVKEEAQHTVVR